MQVRGKGSIQPLEDKPRSRCRKWRLFVHTDCGLKSKVVHGTWTGACKALEAFKTELMGKDTTQETFAAYTASWTAYRRNLGNLAPGTIENDRRCVAALCRSALSDMKLCEVTPKDCREALIWVKQHPASGREELTNTTMNKIYVTLAQVFRQAVDDGLVSESPMRSISPPRPDTAEREALTPQELMRFVHDLDSLPLDGRAMALYFMALLGLRRAEACALMQSDVADGFVHVHQAVKERDGTIGAPKSPASSRKLPLPPLLAEKLDEYHMSNADVLRNTDLLVCNTRGGILRPQHFQRWWTGDSKHNGMREKLGYPDLTFHQLRHSNLSMMARHMSVFDLQRWAGWSSIEPARVYVHGDLDSLTRGMESAFACNWNVTACADSITRKPVSWEDGFCRYRQETVLPQVSGNFGNGSQVQILSTRPDFSAGQQHDAAGLSL